jgi:di/tricarboxylate transporter
MTLQAGLAFALVGAAVAAFVWGRLRYDVVAVSALLAGVVVGVVPADKAFDGFRNDVVVVIACALIVSAAFARSGVVEWALQKVLPRLKTERSQVPVLTAAVTVLSMATKNVGALAIMLPVAQQVARKTGSSPSRLLMPMAFGAMIGGLVTLVGTAPNIIVAEVRAEITGEPFGMFDYSPVGLILTALAVLFLSLAYPLLPRGRQAAPSMDTALQGKAYLTEAAIPEDWSQGKMRVDAVEALGEEVKVLGFVRRGQRRMRPRPRTTVQGGDVLLLEGDQQALDEFIAKAKLQLTRADKPIVIEEPTDEVRAIEAVVGPDSRLVGKSAQATQLHAEHGVNLLGVSRSGFRFTQELRRMKLKAGDIVLIQGGEANLPRALEALGCLPLAEREVRLGGARRRLVPLIVLTLAMGLVAARVAPVAIAFFGAAVVLVLVGSLRMREAYAAMDGPLLVRVACLIPVSDAIQATGGADIIAAALGPLFGTLPTVLAIGGVMLVSMAVTPFLNNAATVLIMAPIGASLAKALGGSPDAFLMAVAVGAACDFLTPIGHQCNTLVMAPGGYRFSDYPRLGAPLSLLVLLAGPPLIAFFWPLH